MLFIRMLIGAHFVPLEALEAGVIRPKVKWLVNHLASLSPFSGELFIVYREIWKRIMRFSALSFFSLRFFFRRSRPTYSSKQLEAHRYISICLGVPRKFRKIPSHVYTRPSLRTLTRPCLSLEWRFTLRVRVFPIYFVKLINDKLMYC